MVDFFPYAAKMGKSHSAARSGTWGGNGRIFCCLDQIASGRMKKLNGGVAKKLLNSSEYNECRIGSEHKF